MEIQYYEHTCLCGCGNKIEIKKFHKNYGIPKYLMNHWKPNLGRHFSEEYKQKISDSVRGKNLGKKRTEEQRQKISKTKIKNEKSKGENNPFYGKKHTEETRQLMKENHANFNGENNPMYGRFGELSGNWQNGISFEPYSFEFNKELKKKIKQRDNHICQNPNCMNIKNLHVHHIDYNKLNSNPENLITLCNSCHAKTSNRSKRKYFMEFYQNIMINRLIECLL